MSDHQNRQPAGIPAGGQFATSTRGEAHVSLVTVPAQVFMVQDEPLLADDVLSRVEANGRLTSVMSLDADAWSGLSDPDDITEHLARLQMSDSEPFNATFKMVAVDGDQVLVEFSNDLSQWARDDDAIDNYNAHNEPGHAMTPEKIAWLRAVGHTTPNGKRAVYDLDNYQTVWTPDGPARVTPCCGASATGTADYVGCRACYEQVDDNIGMEARLVHQNGPAVSWGRPIADDEVEAVRNGIDSALRAVESQAHLIKPRLWQDQVIVIDNDRVAVWADSDWAPGNGCPAPTGRVVARVHHDGRVDPSHVRLGLTGLRQRTDGRFEHNGTLRQERNQCTRPDTGATCVLMNEHRGDCTPTSERP